MFQVMVTNVTSLLKTVKAVEDEHTRGTRALESTVEAIAQEIRVRLDFVVASNLDGIFTYGFVKTLHCGNCISATNSVLYLEVL